MSAVPSAPVVPFDQLGLHPALLRALKEEGYTEPSPIQAQAIPVVLEERDLMATAQTGTGKTAAFALPILHLLEARGYGRGGKGSRPAGPRTLILTPTRELALQIDASLVAYGRHLPFRTVTVLGGVSDKPQIAALRRRPDVLVATPGRLLDLMGQGQVCFDDLEFLVLDEADRMLDMGFIRDVRRILAALPARRQSLLFSATLPREIADLASDMLHRPASVSVAPAAAVADNITQKVLYVEQRHKKDLLAQVLRGADVHRALVFTRTKHRANRIAQQLTKQGIAADAIHSNKSQGARQRALAAFDGGRTRVLVATDIMARGIDVDDISHVINFELPNEPESYVHRIGRTARAGAAGTALSFCNAEEVAYLEDIEKLTRIALTPVDDHQFHAPAIAALHGGGRAAAQGSGNGRSGSGGGSGQSRGKGQASGQRNRQSGGRSNGSRRNGSNGQRPAQSGRAGQDKGASSGTAQASASRRAPRRGAAAPPAAAPEAPAPVSYGRRRRPATR